MQARPTQPDKLIIRLTGVNRHDKKWPLPFAPLRGNGCGCWPNRIELRFSRVRSVVSSEVRAAEERRISSDSRRLTRCVSSSTQLEPQDRGCAGLSRDRIRNSFPWFELAWANNPRRSAAKVPSLFSPKSADRRRIENASLCCRANGSSREVLHNSDGPDVCPEPRTTQAFAAFVSIQIALGIVVLKFNLRRAVV